MYPRLYKVRDKYSVAKTVAKVDRKFKCLGRMLHNKLLSYNKSSNLIVDYSKLGSKLVFIQTILS